ncbi:11396_t:CDS:2 [Racocetra fulgida]|uniref:11396_t:CDS:1 n=1 Tax=Racocetra fulgida TaxID=60492 RepID=A0A9N9ARM1_9GLOM|nr:11396_t:CDS:2 [Racocetra fulgida]
MNAYDTMLASIDLRLELFGKINRDCELSIQLKVAVQADLPQNKKMNDKFGNTETMGKSGVDNGGSLPTSPTLPLQNSFYNHRIIPQGPQVIDGTFVTVGGPKKRRGNLPKATTALLKDWLAKHKKHPYPTEEEKQDLAKETMLNLQQISNWFINARRRHLPLMLNSSNSKSTGNDLDIYPYKAAEKADGIYLE